MNQKRGWSFIGLFVIALVVSMPFYVADAYASSLSITKNQWEKGIKGFINANGDTWTVEATVAGAENINPNTLKIKVGQHDTVFNTCSDSALGAVCEYKSALNNGVTPGAYSFDVTYRPTGDLGPSIGDSDTVKADSAAPTITEFTAHQQGENIALDFTVTDAPEAYCVGLEKIEITDTEIGVLQTIEGLEGKCVYKFQQDTRFNSLIKTKLEGEGTRWLKIKAVDRLGHEAVSNSVSLETDFIKPEIKEISFTNFGEFIGLYEAETDIQVNVTERSDTLKVTATSEQANLNGQEASCEKNEDKEDQWNCVWKNIKVIPTSSVSVKVTAKDGAGNQVEKVLSQSFTLDDAPPKAVFFGTERTFGGVSYVKPGKNTIILKVEEKGSGITAEGIRANLAGLGGSTFKSPDYCKQGDSTFDCYWNTNRPSFATNSFPIGLSYFKDNVGNEGQKPETEVQVDSDGPRVEKIELYGIGSDSTERGYFQSNDHLKIKMTISEKSGLLVLFDLNNLVMDANNLFPENNFTQDLYPTSGWLKFTEEDCTAKEGKWLCEFETPKIKSGYASSVPLKINVYDTAGNQANWFDEPKNIKSGSRGNYKLELLGLDVEETPDFWGVSAVVPLGGENDFVDMDTTEKLSTRLAMKIQLKTDSSAKIIRSELVGCKAPADFSAKQREILYSNVENQEPILIIEFAKFNSKEYFGLTEKTEVFEKAELEYTCQLNIYSQIGKKATANAELQEVKIKIPFAFTDLGSLDENLEKKIKDAKSGYYDATGWLDTLDEVLQWIKYAANVLNIVMTVQQIYNIFTESLKNSGDSAKNIPIVGPGIEGVLKGTCYGSAVGETANWKIIEYIQIPAQILSCTPTAASTFAVKDEKGNVVKGSVVKDEKGNIVKGSAFETELLGENNWYFWWQRTVLAYYNGITGRSTTQTQANSLYDNIYLSALGLCFPGIVYNLQKLREVHCRQIVCLEKEVPQGIATVESCDKLYDLLSCEFWVGPGFALIPGFSAVTEIGESLKKMFTSPLGLISIAEMFLCAKLCFVPSSPGALTACKVGRFIDKAMTLADSIAGAFKNNPTINRSPYCSMVRDLEKKTETDTTYKASEATTSGGTTTPLTETPSSPTTPPAQTPASPPPTQTPAH